MVRVLRSGSSDRILLKGFHGFVRDVSFAFHEKRILVAAVDEYGYLIVHEIIGSAAQMVLQVNPDGITTSSDCHRVVWCPYVPENSKNSGDYSSKCFLLSQVTKNRMYISFTSKNLVMTKGTMLTIMP